MKSEHAMHTQHQSAPAEQVEHESAYFELQATWGITKHLGGTAATDALAALCHIDGRAYVLDVGCGTGVTPRYLAQTIGCRVVGVDSSARMIGWAQRQARRAGTGDRVTLGVADAQRLPFADGTFDAVICESVTAFVPDKPGAVAEYARVTRPGGYVGLAEGTWLTPPPPEMAAYLARAMDGADFQRPDTWQSFLAGAGLIDVVAQCYPISARRQWRSEMGRLGRDAAVDYLRAWKTFAGLLITSAAFRRYVRDLWPSSSSLFRMFDYFGYGVFVGRKATPDSNPY
jgi:SAM-dependent methyltransferase